MVLFTRWGFPDYCLSTFLETWSQIAKRFLQWVTRSLRGLEPNIFGSQILGAKNNVGVKFWEPNRVWEEIVGQPYRDVSPLGWLWQIVCLLMVVRGETLFKAPPQQKYGRHAELRFQKKKTLYEKQNFSSSSLASRTFNTDWSQEYTMSLFKATRNSKSSPKLFTGKRSAGDFI